MCWTSPQVSDIIRLNQFVFCTTDFWLEGSEIWATAETAYNERVGRVENQIISRLRDRLGTARNANEMFRVFSKFNALFVRPKVSVLTNVVSCPLV
jgi:hypothetical protein